MITVVFVMLVVVAMMFIRVPAVLFEFETVKPVFVMAVFAMPVRVMAAVVFAVPAVQVTGGMVG